MYITIDGGTSNTRIYTVDNGKAELLARTAVGAHDPNGLREFLKKNIARVDSCRIDAIIASGMITSSRGLLDLEHTETPAGLTELHSAMRTASFDDISSVPITFIPGVKITSDEIGHADIMRGEETELMGLCEIATDTAYVLPGTHSKCIVTDCRGRICDFFTMLTGEILCAIKNSTIVGESFEFFDNADERCLSAGFEFAAENGINEALFKCRTMDILLKRTRREIYSFCLGAVLSGELSRIAKIDVKNFVFGGKRVLRVPESFLFEKYFGKNVICLDDAACDNAAALGAVKIYECEIKG